MKSNLSTVTCWTCVRVCGPTKAGVFSNFQYFEWNWCSRLFGSLLNQLLQFPADIFFFPLRTPNVNDVEKPVWEKCLCLMNEFHYDGHPDVYIICNLSPKERRVVSVSNCLKMTCVCVIIAIIYKHIHVEMELIQQSQSLQCLKPCSPLCDGLSSPLKKKKENIFKPLA